MQYRATIESGDIEASLVVCRSCGARMEFPLRKESHRDLPTACPACGEVIIDRQFRSGEAIHTEQVFRTLRDAFRALASQEDLKCGFELQIKIPPPPPRRPGAPL